MNTKSTASAVAAPILLLLLLTACSESDSRIGGSGTFEATKVILSSEVGGKVKEIFVDEGSRVESGQLLAEIESRPIELQLNRARAEVAQTEAQLELLLAGARREDIEQAEASLRQAREELEQGRSSFQRFSNLYETGSVTEQQRDEARTRLNIAQAAYEKAQAQLRKLEDLARPGEVAQARARIEMAEANVQLLEDQLEDTKIRSPIRGTITDSLMEAGELARQGGNLFSIADLSELTLVIYILEPELGNVQLGQEADISIDGFPERTFRGEVVYIADEAEFTPENIQTKEQRVKLVYGVKIRVKNEDGILKSGMPADAVLLAPENREA